MSRLVIRKSGQRIFGYSLILQKDIIHLKWKKVDEDFLVFVRAKTENATRDNSIPISIFINEDMKRIISDWGTKSEDKEDYIFPVLKRGITARRQYELLGLFVRSINDWMTKIKKNSGYSVV